MTRNKTWREQLYQDNIDVADEHLERGNDG